MSTVPACVASPAARFLHRHADQPAATYVPAAQLTTSTPMSSSCVEESGVMTQLVAGVQSQVVKVPYRPFCKGDLGGEELHLR